MTAALAPEVQAIGRIPVTQLRPKPARSLASEVRHLERWAVVDAASATQPALSVASQRAAFRAGALAALRWAVLAGPPRPVALLSGGLTATGIAGPGGRVRPSRRLRRLPKRVGVG